MKRETEILSTDAKATTCVGLIPSKPDMPTRAAFILDACKRSLTIKAHAKRIKETYEKKKHTFFFSWWIMATKLFANFHWNFYPLRGEEFSAVEGSENGSTASQNKPSALLSSNSNCLRDFVTHFHKFISRIGTGKWPTDESRPSVSVRCYAVPFGKCGLRLLSWPHLAHKRMHDHEDGK